MLCEYCVVGGYLGMCTCSISETQCPFMRRCSIEHKWLPLEGMEKCTLQNNRKVVAMLGKDEYVVQFERNGKLYVEQGDKMVKIQNPFDYIPDVVKLVCVDNVLYVQGFEPKSVTTTKDEPKKSNTKKKSTNKKDK